MRASLHGPTAPKSALLDKCRIVLAGNGMREKEMEGFGYKKEKKEGRLIKRQVDQKDKCRLFAPATDENAAYRMR